jgi:L-2-hydroxyglutarate oxidase LhgO
MTETQHIGIVGAGIVGLAVARQLSAAGHAVTVFEKEDQVAQHQTGRNSGVVHAGIYYAPGSAKATLTRKGVGLLKAYCEEKRLAYDERGKLVVARSEAETVKLRELERRSLANGVPGVRWLEQAELGELEPDVAGVAALLSPSTAIVDYQAITRSFGEDVAENGGRILLSTPVTGIVKNAGSGGTVGGVTVIANERAHQVDRLVICAGLQADLLGRQAGDGKAPEIIPFRGEYLRLKPHARDRVKRLIYPVPDPRYPFLGVHLTPRVNGESDLGPNAVLALAREGYRRRDVDARELARLSQSGAFRKMAFKNWRAGVREYRGSLLRGAYLAEARTYLPWITAADVTSAPAGVRAQAVDPDGSLVDDFRISRTGDVVTVRNAPSPAATASIAIAEHIVGQLELRLPAGLTGWPKPAGARNRKVTTRVHRRLTGPHLERRDPGPALGPRRAGPDEAQRAPSRAVHVPGMPGPHGPGRRRPRADPAAVLEGDRTDYALEACAAHPDRFGIMARIPQNKPEEGKAMLKDFAQNPCIKGPRLTFHRPIDRDWMIDGTNDWYWPVAEELGIPTMVHAPIWKAELGAIAGKHPGLKIIIDHMGIMARCVDDAIGYWVSKRHRQNAFILAVDVSAFLPVEEFKKSVDDSVDAIKALPPAEGFKEILIPGERGRRSEAERRANGIPIAAKPWRELTEAAESLGVPVPAPLGRATAS